MSLIAELFKERKGNALLHEDAIRKAIESEDDGRAAEESVKLIYSLNADQKKELLNRLQEESKKPEVYKDPKRHAMVSRLLSGIREDSRGLVEHDPIEQNFKGKIDEAYDKADKKGKKFYADLDNAASRGQDGPQVAARYLRHRASSISWPRRRIQG